GDKLFIEKAYINGNFVETKQTFPVVNPATLTVLGNVADCTVTDCREAITAAEIAWYHWRDTAVGERCALVRRLFELINEHKKEIAEITTKECGKPYAESLVEVVYANSFMEWYAEEGKRAYGETIPSLKKGMHLSTIKQGVGVVASI